MNVQNFTSRINNVKQSGTGYTGQCPGHDDKKNSLSITEGEDGRVLLFCHAGCTSEKVVTALGLNLADLYPETKQENKVAAEYLYYDLDGNLVHKTIRFNPKGFTQCRPDGNGGWIYNLKGIKPVLYNLHNVMKAINESKTIFIVEGEKDVDNMGKIGLTCTTSPMGAGKWQDHYSDYLLNASIIIIPDNDEPGKKHAEQVAKSLYGKAKSIKIVNLPRLQEKQDITDFFKKNGYKEGFKILNETIDNTHEWIPKKELSTTICLADIETEEVSWLWKPYIPLGKLTLLQGDPGQGKTFLALNLASIVTRGGVFPEDNNMKHCEPGIVIYQTAEDGLSDTLKPRLLQANADCSKIFVIDESNQGLTLSDERIEQAMQQLKPKLFIIDPLQAYLGAKTDMHRANEVRPILSKLGRLAEKYNCAVVMIMHLSKATQNKHLYRGLGSIDIPAVARSILMVGTNPNNPIERGIAHIKSSLAPNGDTIAFDLNPEQGFCWKGKSTLSIDELLGTSKTEKQSSTLDDAKDFLEDLLSKEQQLTATEVYKSAEYEGFSKRTIDRAKAELTILTKRVGYGSSGRWIWQLKDCQTPKNKDNLAMYDKNIDNTLTQQILPLAMYDKDSKPKVASGNVYEGAENSDSDHRLPSNHINIVSDNVCIEKPWWEEVEELQEAGELI